METADVHLTSIAMCVRVRIAPVQRCPRREDRAEAGRGGVDAANHPDLPARSRAAPPGPLLVSPGSPRAGISGAGARSCAELPRHGVSPEPVPGRGQLHPHGTAL